jgi:hypothetical protein
MYYLQFWRLESKVKVSTSGEGLLVLSYERRQDGKGGKREERREGRRQRKREREREREVKF